MVNVPEPAAYDVPDPSSAVFHPLKVKPAFTRFPEFEATITVASSAYFVESVGTEPESAEFAL